MRGKVDQSGPEWAERGKEGLALGRGAVQRDVPGMNQQRERKPKNQRKVRSVAFTLQGKSPFTIELTLIIRMFRKADQRSQRPAT